MKEIWRISPTVSGALYRLAFWPVAKWLISVPHRSSVFGIYNHQINRGRAHWVTVRRGYWVPMDTVDRVNGFTVFAPGPA